MRLHPVVLLVLAACGSSDPSSGPDAGADPDAAPDPGRGFQIVSPDVTIQPGEEITYCYYFRTPNTEDLVIKKWASEMTPGSHHMIMYTTPTDVMPPGTITAEECGGFAGGNLPSWTYATQTPVAEVTLPADDGTGLPLGQDIPAGTSGYFQMHYLNASDAPLVAHVTVTAEAHDAGAAYTRTAPYITYNSEISIPPGAVGDVEIQTCDVPAGVRFWSLSTHSHKQSVATAVKDGEADSAVVPFESTSWEHPGAVTWMEPPFYEFASGRLTYECTYDNTGTNAATTVISGPSAATDEMCMATGYYFPATKSLICLNDLGPF